MDKNVAFEMVPSSCDLGDKFHVRTEKETEVLDQPNVNSLVRKASSPISEFQPSSKIRKISDTNEKTAEKRNPDGPKPREVTSLDLDNPTMSYEPNVETTSVGHESAMSRALKIQSNLPSKYPSFVRTMVLSHVASGFTMNFPKKFTDLHLPKNDEMGVLLVDENEKEYKTKYLARKSGLSGGWRRFSIDHKLQVKDVLVFHLIQECKFKVYIVRANAPIENDGAKEMVALCNDVGAASADQYGMDTDNCGSEDFEGIRFTQSVVDFKDVKSFENFYIIVDGMIIDCEIPQHLRVKYYELCCSQKSYLHDQLIDGLNLHLVIGCISETINIADAIRSSKSTACCENLKIWDKTLKPFEDLGMRVGFLRARINKLLMLSSDSEEALKFNRLEKLKAEEELKALEIRSSCIREVIEKLDSEFEAMKMKGDRLEALIMEEATAPW